MFTLTHRLRASFAALSLLAATETALPVASPAATKAKHPASKQAARKQTGYHPRYTNAPADEYFGRLQMSILGVRNKVKDMGLDADMHPDHDRAVLNGAVWVEDAMRDWAKKYPFDHWLPRYAFALEAIYERIPGDTAHKRALKQLGYITAYFPQTVYGKVGRAKIAMGLPTPSPAETPLVETDLQRLAFLDGKVLPTIPPASTPPPAPAPSEAPLPDNASPSPLPTTTATPVPH